MRIDREHRSLPAVGVGDGFEPPENAPVAEMHTIEVADGEGARAEVGRHLVKVVVNLHPLTRPSRSRPSRSRPKGSRLLTSISSPSYASRMFGASRLSER